MRWLLILLFAFIFLAMVTITTIASLERNVLRGYEGIWPDPWLIATLLDAYFGFITFYVWVAYKESTFVAKLVWFVLIMLLGNFAMSVYCIIQLWNLKPDEPIHSILLRRQHL